MGDVFAMINFLKFFAIFGVPFGLITGVMRAFSGRDDVLYYGVFQALFFGTFMAAWAVWWIRRNRRRLEAKGFAVGNMGPRQERQLHMASPPDTALQSCLRALKEIPKARSVIADSVTGTATARTAMTWRSFGERLTVKVNADGRGSSITISSEPLVPTTLIDGGKGVENVETFLRGLSAA
jgi:hypothetical protein